MPEATVDQFTAAGAVRISVGGALNNAAVSPLISAGKEMLEQGSFSWLGNLAPGKEIRSLLNRQ